jgi:hypothetical protein
VRRRLLCLDWGAIVVVALCLIAVAPWLTRPGLPAGADAEIHVPRVAEFARVLADGVLYPRWAPDFYLGYGYPLFNFYAPLVYYLAQPFYLFTSAAGAVKALFVVATLLAGLGTYAFARRSLGRAAGVVAAAAYVYAPYLVLIDPFVRVDLAEYFALAWLPWVLWGFDRLLESDRRANVALAALPLAALALTHNLALMLFAPLLVAYLLLRLFLARERRAWARVVGAGVLAAGLSAVFWLPALAEKQYVVLDRVIGHGDFDFHRHFLTLRELLRPSPALDLGALNPSVAYNLGLLQWGLAAVGWLAGWLVRWAGGRRSRAGKTGGQGFWAVNFMGLAALALSFLTLEASVGVWEAIPALRYVQFPWRLLGLAALPLAWLVGAGVAAAGERWRAWVAGGALLLLLVGALPVLYPPPWTPLRADFSPRDMIQLELDGVALGTTANREYTPVWVAEPSGVLGSILTSYETGEPVDRFDRQSLPPGASVRVSGSDAIRDTFVIASAQPFTATIRRFYFPGWRAWLDGEPLEVAPGEPHGFVTAPLPAGTHTLTLRFGATLPRTVGTAVSVVALLALVIVAWQPRPSARGRSDVTLRQVLPLGGVVIAFFVAKVAMIDRQPDWFRRTSVDDEVAVAQHVLKARFEGQIALLGYDLPRTTVAQDGDLPLTLYWKAVGPVARRYSVFVHLVRPAVHTWGQDDRLNPGDVPATRWPADRYVRDEHRLGVLPGAPPGVYRVEVGLYEPAAGRRLFVLGEDGAPVGQGVVLPQTIRVTRADAPLPADEVEMQGRVGVSFGEQVSLMGYDLNPPADLWLPNFLHVTLFWQANRAGLEDWQVAVRLRDEAGNVRAQIGGQPVDGYYPTAQWLAGEVVRDQHSFWLAEDFPPGRYSVEVSLSDVERAAPLLPVGERAVEGEWLFLAQVEVRKP